MRVWEAIRYRLNGRTQKDDSDGPVIGRVQREGIWVRRGYVRCQLVVEIQRSGLECYLSDMMTLVPGMQTIGV